MEPTSTHTAFLLLAALVGTCFPGVQAKCYFQSRALCEHNGLQYEISESWMDSDCLLCTCLHPVGVGCCEITQHPIDFPDWCEALYDPQSCQITVVQKANPRLPCVSSAEFGGSSSTTTATAQEGPFHFRGRKRG
ncbi:Prostate-associated microseminoprotein [Acipenser ruthenus]|uniref:Prostate-associated microseminoprotein n=1 Tax=Acipenser ruthenus TaxID=7906 RepID=A0A662YWX2_ACIRT|nr:prostate-associated microseminoprotein [Acipenser ruthenus]RXN01155.1 Prostate-associated microseminoprotein [Acipenser ruthenus]